MPVAFCLLDKHLLLNFWPQPMACLELQQERASTEQICERMEEGRRWVVSWSNGMRGREVFLRPSASRGGSVSRHAQVNAVAPLHAQSRGEREREGLRRGLRLRRRTGERLRVRSRRRSGVGERRRGVGERRAGRGLRLRERRS
jgi:hypothetical protein